MELDTLSVPPMIKNHEKSRIIHTASVAGLHSYANMGLYCMTKYSVVAITESLFHDLNEVCDHVKVSLLLSLHLLQPIYIILAKILLENL